MITTVFFDLDDTLLDFHKAEKTALTATLCQLGLEPAPAVLSRYSAINQSLWKRLEQGGITREELKTRRYRQLFQEIGCSTSAEAAARIYEGYLAQQHDFVPGAPELLRQLQGRYRLYLASNGIAAVQRGRLSGSGIVPLFSDIFVSGEIGADKPSRAFFDACFARIPDFCREQSVLIGDSLSSDIAGGKNAGLRTVWYNPAAAAADGIRPDHTVTRLEEIPPLLEQL